MSLFYLYKYTVVKIFLIPIEFNYLGMEFVTTFAFDFYPRSHKGYVI